jgi:transposase-like protein
MTNKKWWYWLRVFFGAEICPQCGSPDITKHGFEDENERYKCKQCGIETYIEGITSGR